MEFITTASSRIPRASVLGDEAQLRRRRSSNTGVRSLSAKPNLSFQNWKETPSLRAGGGFIKGRSRIVNLNRSWIGELFKNQLIAGSAILFAGNMFANFGNYLYHLLMGRMLGPVDYGLLASLISVFYLLSIPIATLSLVVVKFVSALRGQKKLAAVNYFYRWITEKSLIFGSMGFLIFLILSPWLASFLHLDSVLLLIIVGGMSFLGIFLAINLATLQGFLRFEHFAFTNAVSVVIKLILAIFLVYLGYQVLGAIFAALVGLIIGYLLVLLFIRRIIKAKSDPKGFEKNEIATYALPVFFSILAFTSLYTTDIVLVRHYLLAQEAGYYASLATLGKIIFFASSPIIMVMFPMISERHANGKKYQDLFIQSLGLVFLVCFGISIFYFLFPELMVSILYGSQYLAASSYLSLFAIFLSLYSFSYLFVNFYLSIKRVKIVILPIIAAVAQVFLISIFHQNLLQIIWVSISVLGLLFTSLLVYLLKTPRMVCEALLRGGRKRNTR